VVNNPVDGGPLLIIPTTIDANVLYTKALVVYRFELLLYLLQTCLYNMLITNRPSGV